MLRSIIKVKLEKNCCPFEKLENFFAERVFHIDDRKGFKDSSVKLVIEYPYDSTLTLTLPREAIPNSFALELLSSLYKENALALPVILKYLAHRDLSKDFGEISKKLQAKMDQDIQEAQLQHNSEISKEIELCKKDILNVLDGGKSVLSVQLKQKYYSILKNDVKELEAEISEELEDYVNNTNIHEIYQSLNSKIKKIKHYNKIVYRTLCTSGFVAMSLLIVPLIALMAFDVTTKGGGFLEALMYTATPFLVVATLALIIAGVAYLASCYLEHSFAKEMQDFIEGPKYVDKATNTEDVKKLEQEETEVGDYGKKPSAPPYDGPKQPRLYPNLSEVQQPPSYEEACSTVQPKDSQPSSNLDSAEPEQPKLVMDLLESLPEQLNAKLGPVLRPSNTARGVI
ncbi:hypothetical protein [Wolbachia endosymbiont (group A) of Rhinocyllus conicus]|uniref:hypothetical protein n=2 Tax=unclassified Wolbachia TaxID=2640676 RepID=UPI00222703A7|nr:hypothetical protein [Wolbachia endosymbiont (group A) of Rhinocyllus conicus]